MRQHTLTFGIGRERRRRGFTAVEVMMVATIIAIITLLAMPIFRKQISRARLNACRDEMAGLAKAEALAYADTGYYFRLNDLDNTTQYYAGATTAPLQTPLAVWNRELTTLERPRLYSSEQAWGGPYASFSNAMPLEDLVTYFPDLVRDQHSSNEQGPVLILESRTGLPAYDPLDNDLRADKYPLDPWGNPYIFFGEGRLDPSGLNDDGPLGGVHHTFYNAAIYSLGPDGLPGSDQTPIAPQNYWRYPPDEDPANGGPKLGTGDDLVYEF